MAALLSAAATVELNLDGWMDGRMDAEMNGFPRVLETVSSCTYLCHCLVL